MNTLAIVGFHKHYGSFTLLLVLAAILVALVKGPKPILQRMAAVSVDINLVVGIVALFYTAKPISWFHPIFALGAVGLLHAGAKSEDKAKVVRCFSIALVLLVAAWSVNASWGPDFFKSTLMFKVGATAPVAP
jgi:cytochrome b561